MAAVLHWLAAYFFCCCAVLVSVVSDLLISPYFLSLGVPVTDQLSLLKESPINEMSPSTVNITDSTAVSNIAKEGDEPQLISNKTSVLAALSPLYMEFEPFASSHPFLFSLITHSSLMILLPIYYGIAYARKFLQLPRLSTLRRRLQTGRSKLGRMLVYVNEQFDDCMIGGRLSSVSAPSSFLVIGLLSCTWLFSIYLWRESVAYASVPLGTAFSYFYVLFIPPLITVILKEKTHGLKFLSSVVCFIGIYVYFFPKPGSISGHDFHDTIRAIGFGIASSSMVALYFLFYRLLNPDGWMIKVMGYQGLGMLLFGSIFMVFLHFTRFETFMLPTRKSDILTIIFFSLSRCGIIYCINEALRWGDPLAIGTTLTLTPPVSFLCQARYATSSSPLTTSKVLSLILTLTGFFIVAAYNLVLAIKQPPKSSKRNINYRLEGSPNERRRLIVGSDYVI